mmetsp:Transcript_17513/g.29535  ORF Transcript_17513/g.29535 Transcript_17513/m.29535 type:complete len:512 (-) Transcript_17513:111-1646(-)
MSSKAKSMEVVAENEVPTQQEQEEEEDEYLTSFEALDSLSPEELTSKISDFQTLLQNPRYDEKAVKIKEQCIYKLARLYTEGKRFEDVMALLKSNNEFFSMIPKAKTAKIVRSILNIVSTIPDSLDVQVSLCKDVVEWCVAEKRTFLRQRIEGKLASLLLQQQQPSLALELVDKLLVELKKLDDKQMLTEAHLTEARIYHNLQNIPKAKASLTASRSAANAIYVVPLLQAEIDEMSGTLHCEEGDYPTAYSYFLEAFDAYDSSSSSSSSGSSSRSNSSNSSSKASGSAATATSAVTILQYMILCKVLNDLATEVPALLSSKHGMKHAGVELEAMGAIAKAAKVRSLEDFQTAVSKYGAYLKNDALINHHLDKLYDRMLEANLLKIIYPYSNVEISHIASKINLPEAQVVHKLSQMILDHKFYGILDQGRGHLIIYESAQEDGNFVKACEIIGNMGMVVEALSARTKVLSTTTTTATTGTTANASSGATKGSDKKEEEAEKGKEEEKEKGSG